MARNSYKISKRGFLKNVLPFQPGLSVFTERITTGLYEEEDVFRKEAMYQEETPGE